MSKQYQIPGGPFVNVPEDGTEYALPGYGYLNQATAAAEGERTRLGLDGYAVRPAGSFAGKTAATGTTADLAVTLDAGTLSALATNAIVSSVAQTLGDATASGTATVAIAGAATLTLGDATASSAATSAIVGATAVTLGDATASSAATSAIASALTQTLDAITLDFTANSGSPRTADLAATLDDIGLNLTGTVTQPVVESTGGSGGLVVARRRKRKPSFTVTQPEPTIVPKRVAALGVTLDDAQLVAECVMHESPVARKRRQVLAVLLS